MVKSDDAEGCDVSGEATTLADVFQGFFGGDDSASRIGEDDETSKLSCRQEAFLPMTDIGFDSGIVFRFDVSFGVVFRSDVSLTTVGGFLLSRSKAMISANDGASLMEETSFVLTFFDQPVQLVVGLLESPKI